MAKRNTSDKNSELNKLEAQQREIDKKSAEAAQKLYDIQQKQFNKETERNRALKKAQEEYNNLLKTEEAINSRINRLQEKKYETEDSLTDKLQKRIKLLRKEYKEQNILQKILSSKKRDLKTSETLQKKIGKAGQNLNKLSNKELQTLIQQVDAYNELDKKAETLNQRIREQQEIWEAAKKSADDFLGDVSKGIAKLPIIGQSLSAGFDKFINSNAGKKVRNKIAKLMYDPKTIGKSLMGAVGLGMTAAGVGMIGAGIKANLARQQELKDQQRSLSLTKEQTLLIDATQRRLLLSSKSSVTSLEEARKASAALVKDFGQLGADNEHLIEQQNRLVKYYGMQEEEAANFQKISKVNGEDAEVFRKRIIAITSGFNKLRGSSIPMNEIMKTISNYSAQVRIQFKGTKDELVGATIKAKLLGTSLEDLNGIADNLLNIESSIENQVTAQLVTGRRISLDAARRYALENDMLGLMTELQKQNIDYYTYSHMNRVEQQSTAAALGMNVEQMSKFVEQQELANRLGIKTTGNLEYNLSQQRQLIAAAAENNDELAQKYMLENESLSNQEKLTAAVNKLTEVFKLMNALIVGIGAALTVVGIVMAVLAVKSSMAALGVTTMMAALSSGAVLVPILTAIGAVTAGLVAGATAFNSMPGMASGGDVVGGSGPVVVGENGPEIVRLRRGNSVTPNSQLNTVGTDNKETNELLKQLIAKVDQPVIVKLGETTINELGNQITMKRDYRAGVGNTYNRVG